MVKAVQIMMILNKKVHKELLALGLIKIKGDGYKSGVIEPDEHNAVWDTCHYCNHNCVCCGKKWDNWNQYYDRVSVMLANESWRDCDECNYVNKILVKKRDRIIHDFKPGENNPFSYAVTIEGIQCSKNN